MPKKKKVVTEEQGDGKQKRTKRTKAAVKKFLKDKGHNAAQVDTEVTGVPVQVALCNLLGIDAETYLAIGGTLE